MRQTISASPCRGRGCWRLWTMDTRQTWNPSGDRITGHTTGCVWPSSARKNKPAGSLSGLAGRVCCRPCWSSTAGEHDGTQQPVRRAANGEGPLLADIPDLHGFHFFPSHGCIHLHDLGIVVRVLYHLPYGEILSRCGVDFGPGEHDRLAGIVPIACHRHDARAEVVDPGGDVLLFGVVIPCDADTF